MTGLLGVAAAVVVQQAALGASHLVVVGGIGGDEAYRATFHEWAVTLVDAAGERLGIPDDHVLYLAESVERDPARIDGRSTRDNVTAALTDLAGRAGANDVICVVLIGHGSADGDRSRFNLPGPDMTAADFAALLDGFPTQRIVFVNAATASGDFVPVLSAPNRTIITATKTGFERNESVFGGFFVRAFADDVADVDKDDRVSVLEAFVYANREVERVYEADRRLRTEHAVLDDNGDGEGSTAPDPEGADGRLARSTFLGGAPAVAAAATGDTVLARLYRERAEIEARLEALRARKDAMEAEAYDAALEALLVELALKGREIREREGGAEPRGAGR